MFDLDQLALWSERLLPPEAMPFVVGGMVGVATLLFALITMRGLQVRGVVGRRVAAARADGLQSGPASAAQRARDSVLERTSRIAMPADQEQLGQIRKALIVAGYFSPTAPAIYFSIRIIAALGLPVLFVAIASLIPGIPLTVSMIAASAMAALGLVVPPIYLDWRKKRMQELYRHAFPDFMDLMVVCVEAGQSLQGSIERVSREMARSVPALGTNLHIVSLELRAGRDLHAALVGLSNRLGIDEVKSLTLLLKQSVELGTSLAGTLRVYSDEMRDKRLMRAEAKANALPVKMVVPLGLFMFPVILVVIMLPLILRLKSVMV